MIVKLKRIALLLLFCLVGCRESDTKIPTYTVTEHDFSILIPAKGELKSAKATSISFPGRRPMMISWLKEEFTQVKKGDVVAKFDSEKLLFESQKSKLEIMLIDKDIQLKNDEKVKEEIIVDSERYLVKEEFSFAEAFTINDIRLYSKLEIIDSMQNKEFLAAKQRFLDWKMNSVTQQSEKANEVLTIRKQAHKTKYKQYKDALFKLQIKAPFDGLLVYEKNWRGERPFIGQTIFPGTTIAKIPNLKRMQAKLFVLDKDAIGIKPGQNVELTLDAYPDNKIMGKVLEISSFSRTVKRGNPIKYFDVTVELSNSETKHLIPGRKLSAKIQVGMNRHSLLIPIQTIYNEGGRSFVYKKSRNGFIKQDISMGDKNLYFVEITAGLKVNDIIALSSPQINDIDESV